ncbi:MAG: preprotein translocase subunit SecG [Pseudomonadota bacterium]
MQTILVVVHLFLAIGLVGLILIQHGKGADAGAAFGSGASGTVFGAQGSTSFLTRTTAILAALFFVTSMVLAYFAAQSRDTTSSVMETMQPATEVRVQEGDVPLVPAASDVPVIPAAEPEINAPVPQPRGETIE